MDYYFSEVKPKGIVLKTKKNALDSTSSARVSANTVAIITTEASGG
jgi:penicillin-binding protein 2